MDSELSDNCSSSGAVFTINGKVYSVGNDIAVNTSLVSYIRNHALLPGTKVSCKEGSCGSCVVNLKYTDSFTKKTVSYAVNSCLMPVLACHGAAVTTVEGTGSRNSGYNKVQTTLANFNGTQCGFCSPGFVMTMYSLLDQNSKPTVEEVENQFSGNLCRCTGYRPILDAFKSLSSNPPIKLKQKLLDIEEAHLQCPNRGNCDQSSDHCKNCPTLAKEEFELDFVELALNDTSLNLKSNNQEWYKANTIKEIFELLSRIKGKSYILLAGNTARGVKKPDKEPQVYIDINNITEMKSYKMNSKSITIGSGTRLKEYIDILRKAAANNNSYKYCSQIANHISLVANIPIRNRATIGGNLAFSNANKNFPSDVLLLLDAVSAAITINDAYGVSRDVSVSIFRTLNLSKSIVTKVTLPAYSKTTVLRSYKVMPVNQTAVAIVNGAFLYDINDSGKLNGQPTLVFSGINPTFRHASNTEKYLNRQNLFDGNVLKKSLSILWSEILPQSDPTSFSSEYRKLLAVALFYRSVLSLAGDKVSPRNNSGATELSRSVSSGKQVYQTHKEEYPLTKPIPKLEALIQTAGEATYVNDLPMLSNELVGHLVLARNFADILSIDPSEALKIKGVIAFYSAKDIPGQNLISFLYPFYVPTETELFASKVTRFWGQPIGILVAKSEDIAEMAAKKVKVNYKPNKKPLVTVKDVLASSEKDKKVIATNSQKATKTGRGEIKFDGEVEVGGGGQYGHAMETPTCRVEPQEDNQYKIWVTANSLAATRQSVGQVMALPLNKIDCIVPRVGGSYGSKNTSQLYGAASCAVAASKLMRPIRMRMTVQNEMDSIGKRCSYNLTYKGEVDKTGKIQQMDIDIYVDTGYSAIKPDYLTVLLGFQNYFLTSSWNINIYAVFTDKPPIVILRGPGFVEGIAMIDQIMEHIAFTANLNPVDVRLVNSSDSVINGYINDWLISTEYNKRLKDIDKYNEENRWKKKGLALTAIKYPVAYADTRIGCQVDILYPDGTVQVQHGGVEMGQGINTKVVQGVAYELDVPITSVQIKPTSTYSSTNSTSSLGSVTSELAVNAAIECCKQLNDNLKPIKDELKGSTWKEVVSKAFQKSVPLSVSIPITALSSAKNNLYYIYGVCVSETELDVLTGQHQVTRVDILEDTGKSMSPEIDVGQVEGGFVMAMGLLTTERHVFDKKTGALLTNRLWFYHIPRSKDIPIDFRVTFVPNATNPVGVRNSKATGEPSTSLAISVINSIRYGLKSARKDAGLSDTWIKLSSPCTPETIAMACGTSLDHFTL